MKLIFNPVLFLSLWVFTGECKAEGGIDFNVFKQSDYQAKFERAEVARYNTDILKDVKIVTFKYNRTIAVVNATGIFKVDLVNIIQAYKYKSNEYRLFPLRFAMDVCKTFITNVAGTNDFMKCGKYTVCPIIKGVKYHLCNWYPNPSKLPPLIPNGQYKIEIQILQSSPL